MNTVLEVENLQKIYMMGSVPVEALAGVSFKIDHGELVAVQGPSGSGKSTLLNMIGALDRPSDGSVTIEGVDAASLDDDNLAEVRQKVGFVFQFFNLIPRLNARDNAELPLIVAGVNREERRARSLDVLARLSSLLTPATMRGKTSKIIGCSS